MKSKLYAGASLGLLKCNGQLVFRSSISLRLKFPAVEEDIVAARSKVKFMSVDGVSILLNSPPMDEGCGGQCSKLRYDSESSGSEFQYSSAVDAMGMNENHVRKP